jgi:hypothetical protein
MDSSDRIDSLERIDSLISLLANKVLRIAANKYLHISNPASAEEAKTREEELADAIELIRVAMANNSNHIVKQATNDVDAYLQSFGVDSEDVDFYKFAYFYCFRLSTEATFTGTQRRLSILMAVMVLDGFVRAHTNNAVPDNFLTKICTSVYKSNNQNDYGQYGIYSVFKIASKCWLPKI